MCLCHIVSKRKIIKCHPAVTSCKRTVELKHYSMTGYGGTNTYCTRMLFFLLMCKTPILHSSVELMCKTPILHSYVELMRKTPILYSSVELCTQ